MLAAKCNDVTAAKRLIVTSNINEVNAAGSTALHFAAFYDSVGVAEILLDKEADVNLKNNIGWSALIYAAKYGHTKIGTLLLENKADLNLQNKEGWSALMEAARYGHTKIGTMLVDNKADLNLQDKDGWTALMDAARYGHTKIGTLLVEKKAEVNLQTINGWSALMFAARYGHTKIGTLLVENKADVNIAGASGGTALLVAVEQGHLKIAEDLVEHGADVNAQGLSGKTSLMKAAQKGDKEMVKYLIDKAKASVFPISGAGATAQQMAADSFYDKFLQKKTLASRLQSPSLMQKLHYMVFDTFCLQYLLVGICVGGIVPWPSPWSSHNGVCNPSIWSCQHVFGMPTCQHSQIFGLFWDMWSDLKWVFFFFAQQSICLCIAIHFQIQYPAMTMAMCWSKFSRVAPVRGYFMAISR